MKYTNGDIRRIAECIDSEDIVISVLERLTMFLRPEDVFEERELDEWAKENGYIKKEE